MIYGYARVSTYKQSYEPQVEQLIKAGVPDDLIYREKYTGKTANRPQFQALLQRVAPGDTITVAKIDRLGRDMKESIDVIDPLLAKDVKINVLNIGTIDNSTTGRLIMHVLLAVADSERATIVERTVAGKEYAKRHNPDYHEGRPKRALNAHNEAIATYSLTHSLRETANAFNVGTATVSRLRKLYKETH